MPEEKFIQSSWTPPTLTSPDEKLESSLRPHSLHEFLGQEAVCERLGILLRAAKTRKEPLGHILFHGPPGVGKTTLAHLIAHTMGTTLVTTSGPVIDKAGDLAGLLTNLKEGDVLFIDEIHRLSATIEEYLYPAMEDFALDLLIDSGPSARSVQVKLNQFTLVGATTRSGLLSAPLRSRFSFTSRLDYYSPTILKSIVLRSARFLNIALTPEAAQEIGMRSRGTPRIANHLLRWTRDFACTRAAHEVDLSLAKAALDMLSIDGRGLDETDARLLSILIDHYGGGPVGIETLAVALAEEAETVAEVHEPYLILQGFIKRTPRGRQATPMAYTHLGKPMPAKLEEGD